MGRSPFPTNGLDRAGPPRGESQQWLLFPANVVKADCPPSTPRLTDRQYSLHIEAVIRDETDNRLNSDFGSLRQEQRILDVDTKVSDRVLYLGVAEQYLDRTDITRRPVDHGCLRAAK